MESPRGTVLNVNVPNVHRAEGLTLAPARLAPFGIVHTTMAEAGKTHVHLALAESLQAHQADTVAALLGAGAVTVTGITGIGERDVYLDVLHHHDNVDAG